MAPHAAVTRSPRLMGIVASMLLGASLVHAEDRWAFTPPTDAFDAKALLDMRSLNEHVAGEHGFVHLSTDGNDFVLGDGQPAHFWAMNIGGTDKNQGDPAYLAHEARWLAKRGVNLVRLHMAIQPANDGSQVTDVNADQIANVMKCVAAFKKEGIYADISPYWAACGLKASWGIHGHSSAWGVLFCDKVLQSGYRAWMKALYAAPNPYTGMPLGQDPAVAVIQLQNEDSLLFWTTMELINQGGDPYNELRDGFATYAEHKHGSIDAAMKAWGNTGCNGDDPGKHLLGFIPMWEILSNPGGPKGERAADQVGYFAQTMHDFNHAMESFLRNEIGCKQLINATNWRTADTVHLNDAERWAYTANEVSAVNKYYSQAHVGPDCGWAVDPGDGFINESITHDPLDLPTNVKQTVGQPFMITESSWVLPNLYISEGPLMVAAYSSLTGMDAYFWFASGSKEWDDPWYHFRPIGAKWSISHPMGVGQFPAAAWMFRHQDVRAGQVVVHEERTTDDIFHERQPLIAEEKAYDPNRDADKIPTKSAVHAGTNPLAFLVGRVEVVLGGKADPAKNKVLDLTPYINDAKHTITSTTKELTMDTGRGLFTVDTPNAQAVAGFVGAAGPIALTDCRFTCTNPYATIIAVTLDGRPLRTSRRILVQIGTTTRATNWADHEGDFKVDDKTTAHGRIVDSAGTDPWTVESAHGSISIRNSRLGLATVADANLMPASTLAGTNDGTTYTVDLPPSALYLVLTPAAAPAAPEHGH